VKPHLIGLTGGIGSGKSTVAAMFSELGVPVLDLDQVGRQLATTDDECLGRLVSAFGKKILQADGSLDRKTLAMHCFSDADETARLNAIMHPLIWRQEEEWLSQQQSEYVIIEASVLLESGGAKRMHAVIVILADETIRLQRVLARGHQNEMEFRSIQARQCDDNMRMQMADHVIKNNGSLQKLQKHVLAVQMSLQQSHGVCLSTGDGEACDPIQFVSKGVSS
jgi:dephospho-CoA kinase